MCRQAYAGLECLVHRTPVRDLQQPFPLPVVERTMKMYDTIQFVDAHGSIGALCLVMGVHTRMRDTDDLTTWVLNIERVLSKIDTSVGPS